ALSAPPGRRRAPAARRTRGCAPPAPRSRLRTVPAGGRGGDQQGQRQRSQLGCARDLRTIDGYTARDDGLFTSGCAAPHPPLCTTGPFPREAGREPVSQIGGDQLRELYRVQRGALAQVVVGAEQRQPVLDGLVDPEIGRAACRE